MTQSGISQALMHTLPPEDLVKMQILTQKVWSWILGATGKATTKRFI